VPITLNDLTVNFAHLDRATLLSDWHWLIGDRRLPVLLTAIGDAFLQDTDDGTVHLLSSGEGTVQQVAENAVELQALLNTKDFVVEHFVPSLIVELRRDEQLLRPGQLYGYKIPPCLGGAYSSENLEPTDIEVHFSILGQTHRQTKGLEPGTPITGVDME
jgi:hypothetical protein